MKIIQEENCKMVQRGSKMKSEVLSIIREADLFSYIQNSD